MNEKLIDDRRCISFNSSTKPTIVYSSNYPLNAGAHYYFKSKLIEPGWNEWT